MTLASSGLEPGLRHETAIVDPDARVAPSAAIGPYAVIGPGVEIGERARVGPHVLVERDTRVGADCALGAGAVLGTDPQDRKYAGERTFLEVGERTVIREYATLNRGTAASGATRVGRDCMVMAYAHVAHDCRIGNGVILANAVNMGGHVQIEDRAIVGGLTAIHQFVRIGRHAFVGGASRLSKDVAPYTLVAGNPCAAYGINREGLLRRGFPPETIRALGRAWKRIFRSELPVGRALDALEADGDPIGEVRHMLEFVRRSERGVTSRRGASPGT